MSEVIKTKPSLPDDARLLDVGEKVNDGDLRWNATVKHCVAVTPQDEERIAPGQNGLYCRKKMLSQFTIQFGKRSGLSGGERSLIFVSPVARCESAHSGGLYHCKFCLVKLERIFFSGARSRDRTVST
jgi:hypothetical protein